MCSLRVGWGCGSVFVKCLGSLEEIHPKQPALSWSKEMISMVKGVKDFMAPN